VLVEGAEIKAYLTAAKDAGQDILSVNDFACRDDEAASFRKLIQHAVWSLGNGEPVQVAYPAAIASDFPSQLEARQGLMIRVNNQKVWNRLPHNSVHDLFHHVSNDDYSKSKLVTWGIDGY
jgi:hypothetical protein